MFSHIQIGARDLDRMMAFYDRVLVYFGLQRQPAEPDGGLDEGAPGLRPHYNDDYYGAYCRDPEGNKLCFMHAGALP